MKKICVLIGLIVSLSIFGFGQKEDRVIDFYPNQQEGNFLKDANKSAPTTMKGVELIGISVEGKNITLGKPFTAGEDWLKTLTVRLKNVSDKPISSVRMSFSRPEAKFKDSSLGFSLEFGSLSAMIPNKATKKIIPPGEEFDLTQNEALYSSLKAFMIEQTGVSNITKVQIGMTIIQFEDGDILTTWKMSSAK